jgi:curved DNA-binding protein CbpA
MNKRLTYYDILGLENTNVSPDEVKKARNELIRHLHPDVTNSEYAEEVVKIINEAYEVLSDPKKRREYDLHLREEEGYIKLNSESFDFLINLLEEINEREQKIQEAKEQEIKFIKHNLPKSEYRVGPEVHVESARISKSSVSSGISASSYQSLEGLDRPYWRIFAFIFLTLICFYLLVITALHFSFMSLFFLIIFALIDYFVFSHIKKK